MLTLFTKMYLFDMFFVIRFDMITNSQCYESRGVNYDGLLLVSDVVLLASN